MLNDVYQHFIEGAGVNFFFSDIIHLSYDSCRLIWSYEKIFHKYHLYTKTWYIFLSTDYDDDYYNQNKALDLFKSMDR